MNLYWIKVGVGICIVSLPFLIAAVLKKIPWKFFWSWTFTSVFSTLTFLLLQNSIEKNLNERARIFVSIALGVMFASLGIYMRTIRSVNVQRMGWLFILFGSVWIAISIR